MVGQRSLHLTVRIKLVNQPFHLFKSQPYNLEIKLKIAGNTAAPIIMVAERGAEFIKTRYQRSKNGPASTLGNRFGEDTSGNYASNEGNDK